MKRLFTLCAILITVAVSSCSKFDDSAIWDKLNEQEQTLNDHEKRIAALEELCKQMNTNISALQTIVEALEKNDYITNVSPVRKDGEIIGYTITFAHSDTITIYNGEDGSDGYVPNIGLMKDVDGIYYWTIDGEWLLDGKGNKIQANGIDGINGDNGITPRLKIEDDYWYVSYDDGTVWEILCKAVGEDGIDGDNIFTSITQDDEYVYFNLADGTMITLPKHDMENIQFEDIRVWSICCLNWDTNNDGELSYSEAAVVTNIGTVFQGNINIFAFTELKYFTGLTEISESAFSGCVNLLKLEMPYSIIYISTNAFKNCDSLRYINIPNSVIEIKDSAFSGCISLQEIIIPNSVTSIGDSAFAGCTSTTKIVIPESVTDFGYYICKSCTGELCVECNIPDGKIDYSPSIFYNGVFADSGFDKIVISDKVTTVGDYAFYNCGKIRTIEIGENISNIGYYAFIQEISDEVLSSIFITALTPPSLPDRAFDYTWYNPAYGIQHYTIPDNLKIYVPSASVDDYRAAWSYYSGRIVGYDFEKDIPVE